MQARALAGARVAQALRVRVGRLDGGTRLLRIGFLLFLGEPAAGIGQILGAARGGGQKDEEENESHPPMIGGGFGSAVERQAAARGSALARLPAGRATSCFIT